MIVVDQTSTGGNHPKQVYRFQDHLVLETLLHFRIILGLEYARLCKKSSPVPPPRKPAPVAPPEALCGAGLPAPLWRLSTLTIDTICSWGSALNSQASPQ